MKPVFSMKPVFIWISRVNLRNPLNDRTNGGIKAENGDRQITKI